LNLRITAGKSTKVDYATWLARAGLETVEYADRFQMLTGSFGYTSGPSNDPTQSALVPFTNDKGDFVAYGDLTETEALFVKLDPIRVLDWLRSQGVTADSKHGSRFSRPGLFPGRRHWQIGTSVGR
jgi:hypothetical protein